MNYFLKLKMRDYIYKFWIFFNGQLINSNYGSH